MIDRTLKSGEKLEKADTEERTMQYLYPEGDARVFMDTTNYEQFTLSNEQLGENVYYLLDGTNIDVTPLPGPPHRRRAPDLRRARDHRDRAGLQGRHEQQRPEAREVRDRRRGAASRSSSTKASIRIDTRTGEYVERVKG